MDEDQRNEKIEEIANTMLHDNISPDEQDKSRIQKYIPQVMSKYSVDEAEAMLMVYEALLYRKLKSSDGTHDPLEKGNSFGAGFS